VFVVALRGFEALGFYSAAYRTVTTLQAFTLPVMRAAFPEFAVAGADSPQSLSRMLARGVGVCVAIATPISIGVITLGPLLLLAALGSAFAPARLSLLLLAPSILPGFVYILLSSAMNAANMERPVLWINVVDGLISVTLSLSLIAWLGIAGASIAFTLTTVANIPLILYVLKRRGLVDISAFLRAHLWSTVWTGAAFVAALLLPSALRLSWPVAGALFAACILGFAFTERRLLADTIGGLRNALSWRRLHGRLASEPAD
jgi:O-antigen/teichoic acid export membrane protein